MRQPRWAHRQARPAPGSGRGKVAAVSDWAVHRGAVVRWVNLPTRKVAAASDRWCAGVRRASAADAVARARRPCRPGAPCAEAKAPHHRAGAARRSTRRFSIGALGARAQPLAVDDLHATEATSLRLGEEHGYRRSRHLRAHLVQVDLVPHAVPPAAELAGSSADGRRAGSSALAHFHRGRVDRHGEQFAAHRRLVAQELRGFGSGRRGAEDHPGGEAPYR